MTPTEADNRQYLRDLFAGPFRGHALVVEPALEPPEFVRGDLAVSERPVECFVPQIIEGIRDPGQVAGGAR